MLHKNCWQIFQDWVHDWSSYTTDNLDPEKGHISEMSYLPYSVFVQNIGFYCIQITNKTNHDTNTTTGNTNNIPGQKWTLVVDKVILLWGNDCLVQIFVNGSPQTDSKTLPVFPSN